MAWNIWCYLSAIFTFVSLHWLLSLSVKNVHFHLGGKKLSSYRVWHNSSYMFGFFVKLKKKNCYFWVLPQYENRECGKRFTMSYGLPSFNFFNVFLPFFSSANVPIALDCHEVSYPTHRMIFFSSLAAVYKLNVQGALWKYACSSTHLLHIVGLQKPGEFHNAVLLCVSCNILPAMTASSFNFWM